MQIILDDADIKRAIKDHVIAHANLKPNQQVVITMKAGRGDNGFSATVEITDKVSAPSTSSKPAATPAAAVETQATSSEGGDTASGKSIFGDK
jgi:hypothetical protein